MVLMKYFCFVIPVRLGVLITSSITIIENVVVFFGILVHSPDDIVSEMNKLLNRDTYDSSTQELYEVTMETVKNYATQFWYTIVGIFGACIIAGFFNIYAAISKIRYYSIPFILLRFLEIALYFTTHVNSMLYMKKGWNLGALIAACCAGGFLILLLLYLWAVTVAMYQIIGIVNSKEYRAMMDANRKQIPVVRNPRKQEVSAIASRIDSYHGANMYASDFYGVHKSNLRRIY